MDQEQKSQRSRGRVLESALKLFSRRGYRATSMRDIARGAHVSTGNVYHHFKSKQAIFQALLDQYWQAIDSPDFPVNRALAGGAFPEDLEEVGRATRESITRFRRYVALIYVDVVEFEGIHIRKFYSDMAKRFERFAERHRETLKAEGRLRDGLTAGSAIMLATRIFLNYFAVEILFGVKDHFGKTSEEALGEIADVLRHGMLKQLPAAPEDAKPAVIAGV